ncbi:glycoside hydrolase family 78 protein [Autumnicola musiva]|uniref:alpha-L-rhamnosidase n=1 Tax=Autumnicola musiva TaxID=3075589 RepID=A0ABU3D6X4_9FLAO|nr:glycoside hydrolase family 78 protein [Zunongwangia sp. F117]MDT0677181.1 glycoside hydrolase family 78 protein [Zunongwangia sp. F117]
MRSRVKVLFILLFTSILFSSFKKGENIYISDLQTEMMVHPEGIDVLNPALSWKLSGTERGLKQTGYQILVASSVEKLSADEADLWDSGKVNSSKSVSVKYKGQRLESRENAYWKVKVWTTNGKSSWSEPAYWSMGQLHYNDWSGRWIGMDRAFPWDREEKFSRLSARYFRKEYDLKKNIISAKAYIIGLGLYEFYINGNKIGDQVLAPAPTDYSKNVKYNTFDVTDELRQGENAVATILGNGRYYTMRQSYKPYKIKTFGYPKMLLNIFVEYDDGTTETLRTDNSWKMTADGPIRTNNEYDGEEYDARKEMPGWKKYGYDDSKWLNAEYVQEAEGLFEAQMNEHMKIVETIKPVSINEIKPDTYILDMGQNMVGWIRMKVKGNKGDQVTLRFSEVLEKSGGLAMENLRDAKVTDIYTLKGAEEEIWEPSFVYHGFRYVEITGYPDKPEIEDFQGRVVNDALERTGSFETSNPVINQVYKNAFWGIRGNYKGMPVDCPQRNERQPWLGDRSTSAYGESFIFDNEKLYSKWLNDIQYSQKADGSIPDVAPAYWRYYSDNMTWPGTYLMIADMIYRQFGNVKPIEKHYPSMKKWLAYMEQLYMNENYILTKDSYGDWVAPPQTIEEGRGMTANVKHPSELISTAYHYYYLQLMKKFAGITGNDADIKEYEQLASKVKEGFNNKFYNVKEDSYGKNTLTDNLLPLYFKMIPEGNKEAVFKTITNIIEKRNDGHLSTGLIGTQWLMRSLTENGRADLAYQIATNTTYPSWGYMVENGATTIWELWNGNTAAPSMNSYNHVMLLGDLIIWYYENLAGIKSAQPGFRKIEMNPVFIDGLDHVGATYESVYGTINSTWEKNNKIFSWNISVPGNTTALVYIPAASKQGVKEGGESIFSVKGIKFMRMESGRAIFEVGSGKYSFTSNL